MNEQLEESPRAAAPVRRVPPAKTAPQPSAPHPARTNPPPRPHDSEDDEDGSFLARHWIKLLVGVVLLGGSAGAIFLKPGASRPAPKSPVVTVSIQPLPPLPPPPPPPPPQKIEPPPQADPKMIVQDAVVEDEKPPDPIPKDEPPPAALGTNIKGPGGADGFGLGTSGNGGGLGLGMSGGGTRQSSKWGWYAGQVQSKVAEALRQHPATRTTAMRVEVRIWADMTGQVTRAQLSQSTGDPALDRTLQNELLTKLRLAEPPPEGMPMPIVLRLSARRPN